MNNGANIVYAAASPVLAIQAGETKSTSASTNRTELNRTYATRKSNEAAAIALLIEGYPAEGFSNLFLFGTPTTRKDENWIYFDCVFQGILTPAEGGRDPSSETLDVQTNIEQYFAEHSSDLVYFPSPVYRYSYTVPVGSADRSIAREIDLPEKVIVRNNIAASQGSATSISVGGGDLILIPARYEAPGSQFFWTVSDIDRKNFGKIDEIIESWTLKSKLAVGQL